VARQLVKQSAARLGVLRRNKIGGVANLKFATTFAASCNKLLRQDVSFVLRAVKRTAPRERAVRHRLILMTDGSSRGRGSKRSVHRSSQSPVASPLRGGVDRNRDRRRRAVVVHAHLPDDARLFRHSEDVRNIATLSRSEVKYSSADLLTPTGCWCAPRMGSEDCRPPGACSDRSPR
jgi:hypothetical protein